MSRDEELLSTFLDDADDILQGLFDTLMIIEEEPGNSEKLNELFRLVHTLKGAAALIDLGEISNYAHEIETVLDGVRKGRLVMDEDLGDVIFSSFNLLRTLIDDIKTQSGADRSDKISSVVEMLRIASGGGGASEPPDVSEDSSGVGDGGGVEVGSSSLEDGRNEKGQGEGDVVSGGPSSVPGSIAHEGLKSDHPSRTLFELSMDERAYIENLTPGNKIYFLKYSIANDIPMPLSRALILYRALEEEMMIIRSFPPIEFMEEKFDGTIEFIVLGDMGVEDVKKLSSISGIELDIIEEVSLEKLNGLVSRMGGAPSGGSDVLGGETEEVGAAVEDDAGRTLRAGVSDGGGVKVNEKITEFSKKLVKDTIRVDVEKLDRLMNLVGELVINRTRNQDIIERLKSKYGSEQEIDSLAESIQDEGRIIYDLQESIMGSRMVPIGLVFKRFPMFIRNIAKKGGKKVNLVVVGEDTELDKKLVDGISEPLIHLVRNAVDHGIEPVDERIAAGKPEEGTIRISAYHEYNQIVIEVEDDGRGIDVDRVLKSAIDRGAVAEEGARELTDKEIVDMIFQPGLTTAESVTESSGRGVGMDVVKKKIEGMNGAIEIRSTPGRGTKIFIKLPLTLAIIRALLITLRGGTYALPIDDVAEVIKVSTSDFYMDSSGGILLDLREEIIPLHFMENLFGMERERIQDTCHVIVVKVFDRKEGVIVEGLKGEKEIVIKNLEGAFLDIPGIAGASIMGDGTVVPILDIQELLHRAEAGAVLSG